MEEGGGRGMHMKGGGGGDAIVYRCSTAPCSSPNAINEAYACVQPLPLLLMLLPSSHAVTAWWLMCTCTVPAAAVYMAQAQCKRRTGQRA